MKRAANWLWRRWGQIASFTLGTAFIGYFPGRYSDLAMIAYAVAGVGLLLTGIGLRATSFWREIKSKEARRNAEPLS